MAKSTKYGSTKRFGTRYGHTLKNKLGKIEAHQKQKHECPYCSKPKVKFISVGIWECKKCNAKFTGKAYTPYSKTDVRSQKEETIIKGKAEIKKEEDEE